MFDPGRDVPGRAPGRALPGRRRRRVERARRAVFAVRLRDLLAGVPAPGPRRRGRLPGGLPPHLRPPRNAARPRCPAALDRAAHAPRLPRPPGLRPARGTVRPRARRHRHDRRGVGRRARRPAGPRGALGRVPGGARPLLLPRRELPHDRRGAAAARRDDREPHLPLPLEAARALRSMTGLPTGTVTLVFTDIEGSTRLLHELGERYADALAEHRRAVREIFRAHGGAEVDTQGDAFFYAFADAAAAAAAARDAQAVLAGGPVRVRMGLHTGTPQRTAEGYAGLDVHLGARVAAAGHGGQVVLTKAVVDGAGALEVHDLGEHRVKDYDEPVWLYQLGSEP